MIRIINVPIAVSDEDRRYVAKSYGKDKGKLATTKEVQEFAIMLFVTTMHEWYEAEVNERNIL